MAISSTTLDKAPYTLYYQRGPTGGLGKRLGWATVVLEEKTYVVLMAPEHLIGIPAAYSAANADWTPNIVAREIVDNVPFPSETYQPARDNTQAGGPTAVWYFGGV